MSFDALPLNLLVNPPEKITPFPVGDVTIEAWVSLNGSFGPKLEQHLIMNERINKTTHVVLVITSDYHTLCVIFPIMVSYSWDNTLFASKAKINVF